MGSEGGFAVFGALAPTRGTSAPDRPAMAHKAPWVDICSERAAVAGAGPSGSRFAVPAASSPPDPAAASSPLAVALYSRCVPYDAIGSILCEPRMRSGHDGRVTQVPYHSRHQIQHDATIGALAE